MNLMMLKTELRKIFCRRVVWVSMALFLTLFLALKLQFIAKPGVVYTLEPMRAPLARLVEQEEFRAFVRGNGYNCGREQLEPFLPPEVLAYIEGFQGNERAFRSLNSDLVRILNNYCERRDNREEHIRHLAEEAAEGGTGPLARAKQQLLARYQDDPVTLELNLETSANNLIDINHAVLFPGAVILVILVGLAGSFSDEYACGAAAGLLTARRGRAGVFFAKALAALIFVVFVVLGMQGFYFLVTAVCHHAPGRPLSAASTYGLALTPYAGSVWGFCLRQLAGNLLAGIAMGSLTLCLSSLSRNALLPFSRVFVKQV